MALHFFGMALIISRHDVMCWCSECVTHFSWWADRVSTHVSTPTYLKGIISAMNRQNYTITVDSLRVRSCTY